MDTITVDRFAMLLSLHCIAYTSNNEIFEVRDEMPKYVKQGIIWNIGGFGTLGCMSVLSELARYTSDKEFLKIIRDLNICLSTGISESFNRFYFANVNNFIDLPTEQHDNNYIAVKQLLDEYSNGPEIKIKIYDKTGTILRLNESLKHKYNKVTRDIAVGEYVLSEDMKDIMRRQNKEKKNMTGPIVPDPGTDKVTSLPLVKPKADNKPTVTIPTTMPYRGRGHPGPKK